jgi:hypothetical protein
MKIREGFVSNSSSSNFVLFKKYLTEDQIEKILACNEKELKHEGGYSEEWYIKDEGDIITGITSMDNGILHNIIYEMNPPMKALLSWDSG